MRANDSRRFGELFNDHHHWRRRASEIRAIAALLTRETAREALSGVAEGYDRLARRAEERVCGQPQKIGGL
ncbi:MAG: hypothetical protein ACLPKB_34295 [Xanthobacteraceae bacterium]